MGGRRQLRILVFISDDQLFTESSIESNFCQPAETFTLIMLVFGAGQFINRHHHLIVIIIVVDVVIIIMVSVLIKDVANKQKQ